MKQLAKRHSSSYFCHPAHGIRYAALMLMACLAIGCKTSTYPDPNDVTSAKPIQVPEVMRRDMQGTSEMLNDRVAKGEITEKQREEYISKRANELLGSAKIDKVAPAKAWEYAEIFRAAKRWAQAKPLLEIAVKHARETKDQDRNVNDTLRLAHVMAELGNAKGAVAKAREVFNAGDTDSAPILLATLLEIVPAAEGKGDDFELAKLLEDAIQCHARTIVDPATDAGKVFLAARPVHIRRAWQKAVELFQKSGHPDLAKDAVDKELAMAATQSRA